MCLRCLPAGKNKMKKEPESHKQTDSLLSEEAFPDHPKNPTKGEDLSHVSCPGEIMVCVLRPLVSP